MAEPCRNSGKYTMGDMLAFRSSPRPVRAAAAFSTVLVSIFYLTAQMVGAGKLMELLLGIPFRYAITGVGCLMIVYVALGGMIATTWVQIIKAGLLMTGAMHTVSAGVGKGRVQSCPVFPSTWPQTPRFRNGPGYSS